MVNARRYLYTCARYCRHEHSSVCARLQMLLEGTCSLMLFQRGDNKAHNWPSITQLAQLHTCSWCNIACNLASCSRPYAGA